MHKHLSDMRKVSIRRQDGQTILHRTGCNPEIVGGNWPSNHPVQNDGIPLSGFIHRHDMDSRGAQKLSECVPVLLGMPPMPKSSLQLTQDDRIHGNRIGQLKCFFDFLPPTHECGIRGRVEKYSHYFHISGSIVRCFASASSNATAISADHEPERSSRS